MNTASHITFECALQTQPNIAIILEEVEMKEMTISSALKRIREKGSL